MTTFQPKSGYEYTYELDKKTVACIPNDIQCGNYQFGYMINGEFRPRYVGRSISGLKDEIEQQRHLKIDEEGADYTHFKYSIADSPERAYEQECRDYHNYGGNQFLDNINHPAQLPGKNIHCPKEGCDGHDDI